MHHYCCQIEIQSIHNARTGTHERKIEQLAQLSERKIAQASTHNAKTHASLLGNEKLEGS
jgi:hypothetical protein